MASSGRGQLDSDGSDEVEVYARKDKKTVPKNKIKNNNPYGDVAKNSQDTTNEWSTTASNDGESNTSPRTLTVDESSTNTFRYNIEQKPSSSADVPKNKSGKKKKGHKMTDEKPMTDDGSHMVDTLSDTTEAQLFDNFNKEEIPAATNSSKLKSMLSRESFKNMGKMLTAKMHSSNLDPQDENEELNQDRQNKNQSQAKSTNWIKDRFKKQNKNGSDEHQLCAVLHDIEMDEMNLDSPDEGRMEGNNLLMAHNPVTMTHDPPEIQTRPDSRNNMTYGQTHSAVVDVDADIDLMEMNEKERKVYSSKMCMSISLAVILVAGVILGIVLWAMSSIGLAFQILGPTIFGLSLFALVYKMFLTFIWKEDPYQYLTSKFKSINK